MALNVDKSLQLRFMTHNMILIIHFSLHKAFHYCKYLQLRGNHEKSAYFSHTNKSWLTVFTLAFLKIGLDTENVCSLYKKVKQNQALSISNITDIPKAQPDRWRQRQRDRVWRRQSLAGLVVDTDLSVAQ